MSETPRADRGGPSVEPAGDNHDVTVRRSFDQQTKLFTGNDAVFAAPLSPAPPWLGALRPDMIVLDVACGAGHLAEQVAPHVRQVIGLDLTGTLLGLAADRLGAAGITNVLLQEGNAARLPFVDGSFDLVFSRSALHHFPRPGEPVAEMVRVCRPGGSVAISDMVAPSPDLREPFDALHRKLDPSHARALLYPELEEQLRSRLGPLAASALGQRGTLPLDRILTPAADRDAVAADLRAELSGGPRTGFGPELSDGQLMVSFTTASVRAVRAVPVPGV
ncbi:MULTISPECIES: methyltransferase domain-containing protein [unclassified Frankia]|uniref:methyltransferase domain-containing protein n=1 Tax=unclassified Frankia TaxID=2632575 RepID=UPI001EE45560|nr:MULTISPECIES: methyltransferase domain-containing protein [unclassified Frankia]